ncbi:MAG: ABC transporter permease [Bacteroidales bacterium]|nr:ABC transporter permease [Bacteroidales bacterium]MCF8389445.1 ABC transporter permease [Bacteroidales bacterium]
MFFKIMIDRDKWQEIFQALRTNKWRTFLTAFGVFWGIFMLLVMLGSGQGLENGVTQGFGDFATNSVFIWPQRTTMAYKGFDRNRSFSFKDGDVEAIRKTIPEIQYLAPRLQGGGFRSGDNAVRGEKTGTYSVYGDYPDFFKIDPVEILEGRFINEIDIRDRRKVIVIGNRVYEGLFDKGEECIGEYIRIQGIYFRVVGRFKSKKSGEGANQDNEAMFMPFTTMQRAYNYGDRVGWLSVTSIDQVPVSVVQEKVIKLLKTRQNINPADDLAIGSFNVEKEFKQMRGLFFGIDMLIWIVGIGTLLAGVIGVSNIMLVIVKERTKEIGIQRALGATPMHITMQIINESVFLTTLSGYIGLVTGVLVIEGVDHLIRQQGDEAGFFKNPEIDISIAIASLVILIISGVIAGLIPASRALNIKPIEALRTE